MPSAWPCSGWGLPSRRGRPRRWCALTAPFHPYLCRSPGHRRSALCCPVRQIAPTWLSPAPCPVESRPSSTPEGAAVTRPTHRRFSVHSPTPPPATARRVAQKSMPDRSSCQWLDALDRLRASDRGPWAVPGLDDPGGSPAGAPGRPSRPRCPTARPARNPAPSVVASRTGQTSTGRCVASASAWTKNRVDRHPAVDPERSRATRRSRPRSPRPGRRHVRPRPRAPRGRCGPGPSRG